MPRTRRDIRGTTSPTCASAGTRRGDFRFALHLDNVFDQAYADRADFAFGNYRYFPARGRALFLSARIQASLTESSPRWCFVIYILSGLLSLGMIVHCIKTGGNTIWVYVLVMLMMSLPFVGALLYAGVEILPGLLQSRDQSPRHARPSATRSIRRATCAGSKSR